MAGHQDLAESRGYTQPYGQQIAAGATLEYLWSHPYQGGGFGLFGEPDEAFPNYQWDCISLQPFDRTVPQDLIYAKNFMRLAMLDGFAAYNGVGASGPEKEWNRTNTQFYVYGRYPKISNGDYDTAWTRTNYDTGYIAIPSVAAFEDLMDAINHDPEIQALGCKPVLIVPVGHVMYELNQRMKANLVPGFENWPDVNPIWGLYEDNVHLNGTGRYLIACTFFATYYRENPAGLPVPAVYGAIDPAMAAIIHDVVWDIVSTYPYAGIYTDLTISTATLPDGIVSNVYSSVLTAASGTAPFTWSVMNNSLPAGLALDSASGAITGMPTIAGSSTFTVQVEDATAHIATKSFSITIENDSAPVITTSSLPGGSRGTAYETVLQATGGNGSKTWEIISGTLPVGMELQFGGRLLGAPGLEGTFNFTVQVTDADAGEPESDTQALSLAVGAPQSDTLLISRTLVPVYIDGALDETVWTMGRSMNKTVAGTPDNTALFDALWDASGLYIAAQITDAALYANSATIWNNDAVEVFLDADHLRELVYNADDRHFAIDKNGGWFAADGYDTGVRRAVKTLAGGYSVELFIPWSNWDQSVYENMTVGFDIANADDDTGAGATGRLFWQGDESARVDTSVFGNMLLDGQTTGNPGAVPAAPSKLIAAAAVSDAQIDLFWTGNSGDEDFFAIERKTAGGPFVPVAQVLSGTTTFSDTELAFNEVYIYRVSAWNSEGPSAWSAEASAATPPLPPDAGMLVNSDFDAPSGSGLTLDSVDQRLDAADLDQGWVTRMGESGSYNGGAGTFSPQPNSIKDVGGAAQGGFGQIISWDGSAATLTPVIEVAGLIGWDAGTDDARLLVEVFGAGTLDATAGSQLSLDYSEAANYGASWTIIGTAAFALDETIATGTGLAGDPISLGAGYNYLAVRCALQDASATLGYNETVTFSRIDLNGPSGEPSDPYGSWADSYGLAAGSMLEESPAGDGIQNLMKYALGLDPAVAGWQGHLEQGAIDLSGTDYFILRYTRPEPAPEDLTYAVQGCDSLLQTNWTGGVEISSTVSNSLRTITVRDAVPMGGSSSRFMRLKVTK